jgi:CubicO group peptidase (beta-lactamase class C family)
VCKQKAHAVAVASLIVFAIAHSGAHAEGTLNGLPPSHASDHVRGYVDAVNSVTLETAAKFSANDLASDFDGPRAPQALEKYFDNQRRVTGGIEPLAFKLDATADSRGTLVFRDRIYGGLRALSFSFEEGGDHRIQTLSPVPAPAWALAGGQKRSPADIAAYADTLVARGCRADVFSGALLVAYRGEVLTARACGEANKRDHTSNNVETLFNLGSMNKMFTAVAIAQLVEAHRLRLADHLDNYIDESWMPRSITSLITIEQLLTMRSGLGSYFDDGLASRFQMNRTLDAYKPVMRSQTLAAMPGQRFIYSDTGYFLLGLIIEKASGEDYYDYIRRHVLTPAGMRRTDSYELDRPIENLALGYTFVGGRSPWRENRAFVTLKGAPDGGGYSTVRDLLCFAEALKTGKLVTRPSLDWLWSDHPPDNWGAGFYTFSSPAGPIVGKDGFGPGISSEMDVYVDKGYVVVALSNYASGALAPMDAMRAEIAQAR